MIHRLIFLLFLAAAGHAQTTARVVLVRDPAVLTGFDADPIRARAMIETGLKSLDIHFTTNDIVGIKISAPIAPHPGVLDALTAHLRTAGIPTNHIHIFARGAPWDPAVYIENNIAGKLIWGDLEFGKDEPLSTRSHLPKVLTQTITKLINLPSLTDHDNAGLAGCLYNLSLNLADNIRRFDQPGRQPDAAILQLSAHPIIRQKLVLNLCDALTPGYAGGTTFKPQYTWPHAGLYFSRDPVALDAVCLDLLDLKRKDQNLPPIAGRATHIPAAGRPPLQLIEVDR